MSVSINFKICDNAKECGGIAVCPTGALSYDEEEKSIKIDNTKCIACGLCQRECPIGAIRVSKTEEEYLKVEKEIESDERTTKDLFVDRYGAAPISEFFRIKVEDIKEKSLKNCLTLIEIYNPEEAECLLKSIPIKELTADLPDDTLFYKAESGEVLNEYEVKELPCLLVFKAGKLLGYIEGYYSENEREFLLEKLKKAVK